jgi:hypothetical protein
MKTPNQEPVQKAIMVDIQPRRPTTTELKKKLREHKKNRSAPYWYKTKVALQEKIKARVDSGETE